MLLSLWNSNFGARRGRGLVKAISILVVCTWCIYQLHRDSQLGFAEDESLNQDWSWSSVWPKWLKSGDEHRQEAFLHEGEVQARISGRVVVTGGGGNIGKALLRRLLAAHVPVTSIDVVFVDSELEAIRQDIPASRSLLHVVYGDIRNQSALDSAFTPDVVGVINLAAVSRVMWCLENEADCQDVNVRGVDLVLKAMERFGGDPWLIQASSREVYGSARMFPVHESSPREAANVYGISKAKAEEVVERRIRRLRWTLRGSKLHAIALRLSNVYGGEFDHHERLVPGMMTRAIAHRPIQIVGGKQELDFVHIDDAINAFILAGNRLDHKRATSSSRGKLAKLGKLAFRNPSKLETYNIAAGESFPVTELIRRILSITQSASPIQTIPGDDRFPDGYIGSTIKAARELGFHAQIGVDEGLHRLATAYIGQTMDYLEVKIEETCANPPPPGIVDLLRLDGCNGSVVTYGADRVGYLKSDDSQEGNFWWPYDDMNIEPAIWTFEVTDHSDDEVKVRLWRSGQHFEIRSEGRNGEGESHFRARIDAATGHVRLVSESGRPIFGSSDQDEDRQLFRLTPYCCPNKEAPWPFMAEDPLASAMFDYRDIVQDDWVQGYLSGSRRKTRCARLDRARAVARGKLDRLASLPKPIKLARVPLPTGSATEWRQRDLPACANDCDHPTVCLDTGACMCVESACPVRSRFPIASLAGLSTLSHPSTIAEEPDLLHPDVLKESVGRSNWLANVRPQAARYLARVPEFMPINLTRLPDDIQRLRDDDAERFDKLQTNANGCFSADSALERGVKNMSRPVTGDGLVFLPQYAWAEQDTFVPGYHSLSEWLDNALQHHLPPDFDQSRLVSPFTHDFGICMFWVRSVFDARRKALSNPAIENGAAWSVMGDLNVNCYRPDQDIVIPPRTCSQDKLREEFGDISKVRPIRQRANLATFKGSPWGQGATIRQRVTCPRPYHKLQHTRLEGGASMESYWNTYPSGKDYLTTLNDTVFCPLPAGITGWSTRVIDVIFAGCIPVLIGDQTHHPFWDTLDWSRFSVQVSEDRLDRLEEILLGYSWMELHQLQTNMMLVRDAFLYPSEGDMGQHFRVRGPLFFAMHGTALLRQTRFPT